jgi:hypothetical protein
MKEESGPRSSQAAARMTAIVLCHLALLWFATRPVKTPAGQDQRVWVQLVMPQRMQPVGRRNEPSARSVPEAAARAAGVAKVMEAPTAAPRESMTDEVVEASGETEEPKAQSPDLLQQAIKSVGAIDRQLRAERPQHFKTVPDSSSQRLAKGFAAARAAVKPKWYEAAQTELISAPNDPKRVYRVTTAMGEYCLYYPDKGGISANSDPRSGRSEFGQPMASTCPIPF